MPSPLLFLSHASADARVAGELCLALEQAGFSCWMAPRDVAPGADYAESIVAAISGARCLVVLLSGEAGRSRHVRRELEVADRASVAILPVRLENVDAFPGLEYFVSNKQWCDAIERPIALCLAQLKEALLARLGDPAVAALWREQGGPLADRYAPTRARRLLSLDATGPLALLTLKILARIESVIATETSRPNTRLSDYFDFIAGSGTGALIAIALAKGVSVDTIAAFFRAHLPALFGPKLDAFGYPQRFGTRSYPKAVDNDLGHLIGDDATLSVNSLQCLLMVVVHRTDVGMPWAVTNNPLAKYYRPGQRWSYDSLPLLPFAKVSLAFSTTPSTEQLDGRGASLVDGTFTPFANPSFLLYQNATSDAYRLKWMKGEANLRLVSVGPSLRPSTEGHAEETDAMRMLAAFSSHVASDQDVKCRLVGRCVHGPVIDREVGDLVEAEHSGGRPSRRDERAFTYVRYDAEWPDDARVNSYDLRRSQDVERLVAVGDEAANNVTPHHLGLK